MIGSTISHYKILSKLGEGGMGVVYKAEDTKLRRAVALKFLPSALIQDSAAKERFIQEAQAASVLDHSNICTLYEIDETEDGTVFMAMAYCEGETLKEKIEREPLPLQEAVDIIVRIAEGLAAAHEADIVHRDIKPANIIITRRSEVRIVDFGLAKLKGQAALTRAGTTLGTAAYMSPEQARGEDVDLRTDIWSLGVIAYEMLTGRRPFRGEYEQALVYLILNVDPEPVTKLNKQIPAEFEKIVNKCLSKNSDERYAGVEELLQDMESARRDIKTEKSAILKRSISVRQPLLRMIRKNARMLAGLMLLILITISVLANQRTVKSWFGFGAATAGRSVAVLPFNFVGSGQADKALCDGLSEVLTNKLIRLERSHKPLWIVPAHEVRNLGAASATEARRIFRAALAVTGSMQRSGDIYRLTLNLIDTDTGLRRGTSININDTFSNLATWQENIVTEVAEKLDIEPLRQDLNDLSAGETYLPGAYISYLRGRGYLLDGSNAAFVDSAVHAFEGAVEQDSSFALAYAGLGEAFRMKYKQSDDPVYIDKSRSICNRALQTNGRLAPVYVILTRCAN